MSTKPAAPFTKYEAAKRLRGERNLAAAFRFDLAACLVGTKTFKSGPSRPKLAIWSKRYAQHTDTKVKDRMLALLKGSEASNRANAYKIASKGQSFLPETLRKFNALVRSAGAAPRAK